MPLLEPHASNSIQDCGVPPQYHIQHVDGPKYEVEGNLNSMIMRNKLHYSMD